MDESIQLILRKVIALTTAVMLVVTLTAIAIVKADHDKKTTNVASGNNAGSSSDAGYGSGDQSQGGDQAAAQNANNGGGGGGAAAGANSAAGAAAAKGGAAGAKSGAAAGGATGGCKDANPDVGVFCDHFLAGGTTVLSGPLAVYGDQGLKGGLAWLTYYNTVLAPAEHLRQGKLIWYDDSLDPQKTLQYVQRLHDVDKVLYLGGVTSPEAISAYLEQTKFPMIGDIGLSPKSWKNRYIFPTAPSQDVRDPLRIKVAVERFHIKSFGVIQDVLPSVNTDPDKAAWHSAETKFGVKETDYVEVSSTASDCSAQFNRIIQSKPEYIILPTASGVMLACLREARKFSVQPNGGNSPWLKGWSGGSNLQLEVDSCKPTCEGMYSIGTIFSDPRTSNTPQMQTYKQNMAKYAPNVDITGFIAINYYHAGYLFYQLTKQAGIQNNLTRDTIVNAAEHFGPFDTGFGNTVTWNTTVPREPWTCAYPVAVHGDKWVFDTQKFCL
jgi:ABC-type branched-subunit amino acid transport system substrate-binding protein